MGLRGSTCRHILKIYYIYKRINHHAAHSGYDQLAKYVDSLVLNAKRTETIHKIIGMLPQDKRNKLLVPHIGGWYKEDLLSQEIHMILGVAFRHPFDRKVYHYLYGEDAFRWGASLPFKLMSRIAVSFHQPPDIFDQIILDKSIVKKADAVIVCGSNQVDYFEKITGGKNVYLVPHGIDTDYFAPSISAPSSTTFKTISVGWWLRDVDMIKNIAIKARQQNVNVQFNIVTFPEYHDFYKSLPNIKLYTGLTDENLKILYQDSDALLLPLKDSTANNAILEAMACGKPILTTDVGSVRDYVDTSFGYLARNNDADYLLEAIKELMVNPRKKQEMGQEARRKAMEFDWRKVAMQMKNVYEQIF